MSKGTVAIVGSGRVGLELAHRLRRSDVLELAYVVGCDPAAPGLAQARALGVETSADGVYWLLERVARPVLVFDTTTADTHAAHAALYEEGGMTAVDMTSAALGPMVCPVVNLTEHLGARNVSMITSTAQAAVPVLNAVSQVIGVSQADVVVTTGDRGRRLSQGEEDWGTARAMKRLGGAAAARVSVRYDRTTPADVEHICVSATIPPHADRFLIAMAVRKAVGQVRSYLPGYRLRAEPSFDEPHASRGGWAMVSVMLEVPGNAMVAAAVPVGEQLAAMRLVSL